MEGGLNVKSIFSFDSPVITALTKMADVILLNLLFLATSLPIFTFGTSCTALYYVWFNQQSDERGVVRRYLNAFRNDFKSSTKLFLVVLFPLVLSIYYLLMLMDGAFEVSSLLKTTSLVFICLFQMMWAILWPLQARFENSIQQSLRSALLLSLAHLPRAAIMAALNLLPLLWFFLQPELFIRFSILWLLAGFSLTAKLNTWILKKIFQPFLPSQAHESETAR